MFRPARAAAAHVAAFVVSTGLFVGQAMSAELSPVDFSRIEGWTRDNHAEALATFSRSCARLVRSKSDFRVAGRKVRASVVAKICRRALSLAATADRTTARNFFETNFTPYAVSTAEGSSGLFTGYFEPVYNGSRQRSITYHVPLYRVPPDLKSSSRPYRYARQQIEQGALDGRGLELVYLSSLEDAFFIHIQGSARIVLPDGGVMRVGFAAKTGHDYTPIGRVLVKMGVLRKQDVTMQSIRSWLEANPAEAQKVMWQNRSFIFFRDAGRVDPALGPQGAQGVNLDAMRSMAIDRSIYSYGLPMWLESTLPVSADGPEQPLRRLMIAQDTGSGVKGAVRGDVFVGSGDRAGDIAGRMKQQGRLIVLVPGGRR